MSFYVATDLKTLNVKHFFQSTLTLCYKNETRKPAINKCIVKTTDLLFMLLSVCTRCNAGRIKIHVFHWNGFCGSESYKQMDSFRREQKHHFISLSYYISVLLQKKKKNKSQIQLLQGYSLKCCIKHVALYLFCYTFTEEPSSDSSQRTTVCPALPIYLPKKDASSGLDLKVTCSKTSCKRK